MNISKTKTFFTLFFAASLFAGAGTCVAHLSANADEPEVGQHILEMTDVFGEKKLLPAWYDGSTYLLADYTRNIFVHNGFDATSLSDIVAGVNRFPIYSSPNGNFTDGMAVSLYDIIIRSYDFYCKENIGEDHFGLNGKNDEIANNWTTTNEIPLHAFTHFNRDGYRFNATCFSERNLGFLVTGDGDLNNPTYDMYQQAACTDIIAHEYQHGIARFLNHGLFYESDSGALDEAFADIFGALISEGNPESEKFWKVGEDCTISGIAQRRFDYPEQSKDYRYRTTVQSKFICEKHVGTHDNTCDNNYVHHNSTIVSHVQFTAWQIAPQEFTKQAIGKLWFNTLKLLDTNATFDQFATAIRKVAAEQLSENACNALDYSLYVNGFTQNVMHKVTFVDEEGNVLFYSAVPHGGSLQTVQPEFEDSQYYDYVFRDWDGNLDSITQDITVKAVYDKVPKNFSVRFVQDDGTLIEEKLLPYGSPLVYPETTPQKMDDENYSYRFVGWEGAKETVTGEMRLVAKYEKIELEKNEITELEKKKSLLPLILGIAGGGVALLTIGIVAVLLLKKRQKK